MKVSLLFMVVCVCIISEICIAKNTSNQKLSRIHKNLSETFITATSVANKPGHSKVQSTKKHNKKKNSTINKKDVKQESATKEGIRSGISGAIAGLIQVALLMWLRTTVNYQHRYGHSMIDSMKILYDQGGIRRFYNGFTFAVVQGPLARFGSVGANQFALSLCQNLSFLRNSNSLFIPTLLGSLLAGLWRAILVPIDTCKTVLQVRGKDDFNDLIYRAVVNGKFWILYRGAVITMITTSFTHYPFFLVYNFLESRIGEKDIIMWNLLRSAVIGFASSTVSDCVSNPLRVLKTFKQSSSETLTYREAIESLLSDDKKLALFSRGLLSRIIINGFQAMIFTLLLHRNH